MLPHRLPYLPYNKTFTVEKMTLTGAPRFDAESYARYTDRILQVLETGPYTTHEIAIRLGEPLKRVAWFLGNMIATGRSHIHGQSTRQVCGRYRQRPVYAAGPGKALPQPLEPLAPVPTTAVKASAVNEDDLAWMAKWRDHRIQRLRIVARAKQERAA